MGYPPFSSMFLAFHPGKICEEKQYLKKKKPPSDVFQKETEELHMQTLLHVCQSSALEDGNRMSRRHGSLN